MALVVQKVGLPVLLLVVFIGGVLGGSIEVDDPGNGNTVLYFEKVPHVLGWPSEWDGYSDPPITVNSEFPVSVLRYTDNRYYIGSQPLGPGDIYIVIKSNCSNNELEPNVEFEEYTRDPVTGDQSNYTDYISISLTPTTSATSVDEESFSEPSSFYASWNYSTMLCAAFHDNPTLQPTSSAVEVVSSTLNDGSSTVTDGSETMKDGSSAANDATSNYPTTSPILATLLGGILTFVILWDRNQARNVGLQAMGLIAITFAILTIVRADPLPLLSFLPSQPQRQNDSNQVFTPRLLQSQCAMNVEILINGCRRSFLDNKVDLEVNAPAVRVLDSSFEETSNSLSPSDNCTIDYEGYMEFPLFNESLPEPDVETASFPVSSFDTSSQCSRPFVGRPYVDLHGKHVQATIDHSSQESWWSLAPSSAVDVFGDDDHDKTLGRDWAERALGEHASIASFAAFTIALMSNNAPPDLIRDALLAALDEVSHAKTSFEIASLLLGRSVNPGAMPASHHKFGQDLSSLAAAAAQEGCIEETLSALIAAHDVDAGIDNLERIEEVTKSFLKETTETIALEETRHAALAWRTVKWACSVDEVACEVVKQVVFHPSNLEKSFMVRFGNRATTVGAREAWNEIHNSLVPVVAYQAEKSAEGLQFLCVQSDHNKEKLDSSPLLKRVAKRIIMEAVCPSSKNPQDQS